MTGNENRTSALYFLNQWLKWLFHTLL